MQGNAARQIAAIIVLGVATLVLALSLRPVGVEPAWAIVGGRLVALALLVAGCASWFAGRSLAAAAGAIAALSWAAVVWSVERVSGADALVGAGLILAPLLVPSLILVVVGPPALWRISHRPMATLVGAAAVIAVAGVARALVYEPIRDLYCGLFCGHSPVLVVANPGIAAWLSIVAGATTFIVCGAIALGILLEGSGRPNPRRDLLPRLLAASAMVAFAVTALATLVSSAIGATLEQLAGLVAIRGTACVALAGAATLAAAERLSIERNLARIARLLSESSNRPTAEMLLRDALGDPDLSLGYWVEEQGFVGADGRPIEQTASGTQRTELTSRGQAIAVLLHDRALPVDLVEAQIGPEARLAIQNESLELELERRLDQLRASRRRVVEAGDSARRQLERDLHDGAQQLLLALSFEARRGERSAVENGDAASSALFGQVQGVAAKVLDQLRLLADGIHPAILTNSGLEPALATYARSLATPPRLTVDVPRRLPPAAEASVYAIATGLIAAAPDGLGPSTTVRQDGDVVRIRMNGAVEVPEHVLDRVGAAGGRWAADDAGLEFELPCV